MRLLTALFLTALALSVTPASADQLVVKKSNHNVSETLDRLTTMLKSKGATIFARVDHAAGAKKIGQELPATQLLIFGNPKMGTPLMQQNRNIGLALPMKVLAWRDKAGQVWISYRAPKDLQKGFVLTGKDKLFNKMSGILGKLTDMAAK